MMVRAAVGPFIVVHRRRWQGDGDVLWLFFPLLFDFDWRKEMGRFGDWGCGPVRLLALRQRGDGGRGRGRGASISLGGVGSFIVVAVCSQEELLLLLLLLLAWVQVQGGGRRSRRGRGSREH